MAEPLVGRLADDHVVRTWAVRDEPLGAERRVLLVRRARDDDGRRRGRPRSSSARCDERRRDGALHVVRAAAVQTAVANLAGERVGHRRPADGVEVTEQHHRATTAPAAADEHVRAARRELVELDVQALRLRPLRRPTRTAGASPEPAGSSDGFTDSARTSAAASSVALMRATLQRLGPDVPVRACVRDATQLVRRKQEAFDHPPRHAGCFVVGEVAMPLVVEAPHRKVASSTVRE